MKESTPTLSFYGLLIVLLGLICCLITWTSQKQIEALRTQLDVHRAWDNDLAKRHHGLWMSFEDFKEREDFCKCEKSFSSRTK